jgi:hypothetical protein
VKLLILTPRRPRDLTGVNQVLPPPVLDRLIGDIKFSCDLSNQTT